MVDAHIIEVILLARVDHTQVVRVGPYRIGATHTVGLSEACEVYEHVVNTAIAVIVIVGEVDISGLIKDCTSLGHHFMRTLVIALAVVASVVRHFLGECDRAVNIELRSVLTHGVLLKVVGYRPYPFTGIESRLID